MCRGERVITPLAMRSTRAAALIAVLALGAGPLDTDVHHRPRDAQSPSSYQLISAALAQGRIDAETAHKYRIFAAFTDERLPLEYRGDDSGLAEVPGSVEAVGELLSTFSAQTRAELAPFFLSPADPGSWLHLETAGGEPVPTRREPDGAAPEPDDPDAPALTSAAPATRVIEWHTVLAAGGKVKVWAQKHIDGDSAKAEALAREITTTIWPALTGLFWEPLPDDAFPLNSGGPETDIFLVRPIFTAQRAAFNRRVYNTQGAWAGLARRTDPMQCQQTARYLLVNSAHPLGGATTIGLAQITTHELAHSVIARMPLHRQCNHYRFIDEATATWTEHRVYPRAQSEQPYAPNFFDSTHKPFDDDSQEEFDDNAYAAYVFPFYLQLVGLEGAIPTMWRKFEDHDRLDGIDAALRAHGTSLEEVYPEFAVRNLNQIPVDEYRRTDALLPRAVISVSARVAFQGTGATEYEKLIAMGMPYLASRYAHFQFERSVRTVTFDNPLVAVPHAAVWGIAKIRGQWQPAADWSKDESRTWCRDDRAEDIEELYLVFVNRQWQNAALLVDPGAHLPTLTATPAGCGGLVGISDMVTTLVSTDPALTIVESVKADMRFVLDSTLITRGQPAEYWKTAGGTLRWHVQVTGQCSVFAEGVVAIPSLSDDHVATLHIWNENGRMHHSGTNGPWPGDLPQYTLSCPEGPVERVLTGALGFFVTDFAQDSLATDGKSFGGNFAITDHAPAITTTHKYLFRCRGC